MSKSSNPLSHFKVKTNQIADMLNLTSQHAMSIGSMDVVCFDRTNTGEVASLPIKFFSPLLHPLHFLEPYSFTCPIHYFSSTMVR